MHRVGSHGYPPVWAARVRLHFLSLPQLGGWQPAHDTRPTTVKKTLKSLWPYLRIMLSVALLWLAVRNVDWLALTSANMEIEPVWLVLAVLSLTLAAMLAALRWGWLMRSVGLYRPWLDYVGLYFSAGLINQGLPSTIGGDSYRAIEGSRLLSTEAARLPDLSEELHQQIDVARAPPRLRLGFLTVAMDRGLGLLGNNLLGAVGLVSAGLIIAPWGRSLGWLVLLATLGGVGVASALLAFSPSRQLLARLLSRLGMPAAMSGLSAALGWPHALAQLAVSVLVHVLTVASLGLCMRAFGTAVPFEALMVGLPTLSLLMVLPISISGWGLRETTLTAILALWAVPPTVTVLGSVSYGLVTVLIYAPGAFLLIKRRSQGRSASSP